ncbi:MAG: class I SAM-dependent methyltransferase [Bacteroidota bacterium]|nr:class I SAM-dependent methyltransferase [Bacteroidota bacterium]
MICRFCKTPLTDVFIDLINSPASNSFLTEEELNEPESYYPLKVFTCANCFLVQVDEYKKSDSIFNNEYVYFSSYSTTALQHAKQYVDKMMDRFHFNEKSQVIEIASNDGYLLQYFKEKKVPVLGIEPTGNTADVSRSKGIENISEFFGTTLAKKLVDNNRKADLLLGNNVLAHVPDIVDFIRGMKMVLKEDGVITMEFPHLMQLVDNNQFDTIYHEHFSYLSFYTVCQIFKAQGLEMFDVEEVPVHGGSLRIYAKHENDASKPISNNVQKLLDKETGKGMNTLNYYNRFAEASFDIKLQFTEFLIEQKKAGKKVAGYGAAAKGNTLLNYCGIKNDLVDFVVDANPHKQNKWLPGSHIKVVHENVLKEKEPDYVVIFPWNLQEEVMKQLHYIKDWGGKFVIPIPHVHVV